MRTVGVDLSAEPSKTATATVLWEGGAAIVENVALGVTDDDIRATVGGADRCGIDAPFGWPDAFVELVVAHRNHEFPEGLALDTRTGRQSLVRRLTDRLVHAETGIVPLSVSADLIAHVALRCAGLLASFGSDGFDVDRVDGFAVEVYPAAALRIWGQSTRGYKGPKNRSVLEAGVEQLERALPGLRLGEFRSLCTTSDDAFDALVAAIIARAVALGCTRRPEDHEREIARREGWIHLPSCDLATLLRAEPN